jgi:ABC-type lipoprotein export system ATPase subunit
MADITPPSDIVLRAEHITKTFAQRRSNATVLNDISLKVMEREFLIISGQSGSGKTTFLNIISGLETPTTGSIFVNNENIYSLSADARARFRATRYGIVYQQAYWVSSLNVVQNVALPLLSVGVHRDAAEAQAKKTLEKLELGHLSHQDPLELSGGEQQRVGIARAIVHDPKLIIADEPTGNLDTHNSDMVMSLFSLLSVKEGRTIILVTHNPIYEFYGTHFVEVRDGQIIKDHYNEA